MIKAVDVIGSQPWLIEPSALERLAAIADRQGNLEAVAAKVGARLERTENVTVRDGVAVIQIIGPIFRYANLLTEMSGATSTQILATDFRSALDNPSIKQIVLDIDSPGGEATGISELAQQIYDARSKKPITAYVAGMAGSAAYWIASAASKVICDETAMLGSIGVVMTYTDSRGRDEKAGIQRIEIVSSASPDKRLDPTSEAGRAKVQKIVDDLAAIFVASVARNRGTTAAKVQSEFGRGGMVVAKQAISAGMANGLGSLERIIAGRSDYLSPVVVSTDAIAANAAHALKHSDSWDRAAERVAKKIGVFKS